MSDDSDARGPHQVDLQVGRNIRDRRKALGVSQEKLAESIGVTFQQVQKYEKGTNRVSASKIWETARALQMDYRDFFAGLTDPTRGAGLAETGQDFVHDAATSPESQEMAAIFARIRHKRVRKRVLELARALADEQDDPA